MKKTVFKLLTIVVSLMIVFIAGELLVRAMGRMYSWSESNGLGYISPYKQIDNSWYHLRSAGKHTEMRKEFSYELAINVEGFRDTTHQVINADKKYRIIGLGDSFTEGFGSVFDSTWLAQLSHTLNKEKRTCNIEYFNAGVSGSDPFFCYVILRDKLLKYSPNLVIVGLNYTDFNDFVTRGGIDRFFPCGKLQYKEAPKIEWLFKNSLLVRNIMINVLGYDWLMLSKSEQVLCRKRFEAEVINLFKLYKKLGDENGFKLLVLIHPGLQEVREKKYMVDFSEIESLFKENNIACIDILPSFISYIDSTKCSINDLYWPIDYHNKARGYSIISSDIDKYIWANSIIN